MNNPLRPRFEIMIDGGVRRATDVLKAVALGATAVGIGRPMIYAMSTYGEDGVSHLLQILKVSSHCSALHDALVVVVADTVLASGRV
jgi:isopentenyl diphosphate isomerase/L-lactate dehydrogenase-like FMN-dependent dehydrogenase